MEKDVKGGGWKVMVYLVLEYERGIYYIPFKNMPCVDEFTSRYTSPLELCAVINDFLELNIPREEMLDAYLSDSIDNIYDDMQEYNKRYLAVKYKKDNYDNLDLEIKFSNFIKFNMDKVKNFIGLDKVIEHYKNKYCQNRPFLDRDVEKIALAYLGSDYKRRKECFFKLKDLGYKAKINDVHINYSNLRELAEEEKMMLMLLTNKSIPELKSFVYSQNNKGIKRWNTLMNF